MSLSLCVLCVDRETRAHSLFAILGGESRTSIAIRRLCIEDVRRVRMALRARHFLVEGCALCRCVGRALYTALNVDLHARVVCFRAASPDSIILILY